jgi:hypothetical protein
MLETKALCYPRNMITKHNYVDYLINTLMNYMCSNLTKYLEGVP